MGSQIVVFVCEAIAAHRNQICRPCAACWMQVGWSSTFWWLSTTRPAMGTLATPPPCTLSASAPPSTKVWDGLPVVGSLQAAAQHALCLHTIRFPGSITAGLPSTHLYADAITAVGRVLEHYDTDKQFPAWGFGAALPPSGAVSHCFALNGNPADPEVAGVQGILQAYRQTLSSVRLSGPTLFAPIINAAAQVKPQALVPGAATCNSPAPLLSGTPPIEKRAI